MSRFQAGFPALRSQTMRCAPFLQAGISCDATRVTKDGQTSRTGFAAQYDGRRYAVTGDPEMDGVSLRRENQAVTAIFTNGTRPMYGYRISPSGHGRLTIRSIDPRTQRLGYSIVEYEPCRS
ncbi:MAG TPA: hypothetical protein VFO29_03230 [Candidatus Rubrimentiphilum sp.]|nr:hypothetical protein [Candidatus Rubrimentiphilum sp.]